MDPAAPERRRDPHANEWQADDILHGWGWGAVTVLALAALFGLLSIPSGFVVENVVSVTAIGLGVLTIYGVPVATAAAILLRPVPQQWIHLLAFAVLGAAGGVLAIAGLSGVFVPATLAVPAALGAITAVLARIGGWLHAVRTRGATAARAEAAA